MSLGKDMVVIAFVSEFLKTVGPIEFTDVVCSASCCEVASRFVCLF